MFISRRSNLRRIAVIFATLGSALSLVGCADYINHRDRITLAAGDSQKFNQAVHVIDPSPPWSRNTDIDMDGQRAAVVIDRYSTPPPAPTPTPDVGGTTDGT